MHAAVPILLCQMKCLPKVNPSRATAEYSQIQKEAYRFSPKCFLDSSGPVERGTKNIPVLLGCGCGSPILIWKQKERRKLLFKGFHGNECLQKTLRIKSKQVRTDAESKKGVQHMWALFSWSCTSAQFLFSLIFSSKGSESHLQLHCSCFLQEQPAFHSFKYRCKQGKPAHPETTFIWY